MALLNLTAFTPQMAYSVCATLEALGGEAGSDALEQWMSPAAIYANDARPRDRRTGPS